MALERLALSNAAHSDLHHPRVTRVTYTRWKVSRPATWPDAFRQRVIRANLVIVILLSTVGVAAAYDTAGRPLGASVIPALPGLLGFGDVAIAAHPGPLLRVGLPVGKGMWIYEFHRAENGDAAAIVARALDAGLTHLYVRAGSWVDGFYAGDHLNAILPAAHAAGLQVFGWDFPRLGDQWPQDVARAQAIVTHRTPDGHGLDGFSADIETKAEGTIISGPVAREYGRQLRALVGAAYPLIATVPRPSSHRPDYPYAEIVESFDAIAPMVYWLNRQPDTDVAGAINDLAHLGKPIYPVGQAYDGHSEGGRQGVPTPDELTRFIATAEASGSAGISFWSWQHADLPAWSTIRDAPQFSQAVP